MIVHRSQLGTIGCGEFAALKERLKLLLEQAQQKGLTGTNAYIAAQRYYEDHSGLLNTDFVLLGSYCTSAVKEINDRIANLTAALTATGTSPVVVGPEYQPPESGDFESVVKWVIGGVIAVAGAWTATIIIPRVLAKKKAR